MLHHINVWFLPFRWGINTYRGCEHNCVYCNARYTHEFLNLSKDEFTCRIIVKDNAAEILDRELSREKWHKNRTVNLATVTDPYQPAESKFRITREVLEVFLKHHNALLLTTKSDLVLRDLDLLTEICQSGFLNVVITLPTLNEELRRKLEPKASCIKNRLEAIRKIHEAGITTGVACIPLMPYISDDEHDLEALMKTVAETGADYVIADIVNFKEEAGGRIVQFLKENEPELQSKYEELYQTKYCDKGYAGNKRKVANSLIKKYKLNNYDKMFSYRKAESE
jgi:DNA repair photolyase